LEIKKRIKVTPKEPNGDTYVEIENGGLLQDSPKLDLDTIDKNFPDLDDSQNQ
jgi:hypothetical protein